MVCSVAGTMKSLCWTVILIMLLIYVVGVYITQMIAEHATSNPEAALVGTDLEAYYGTLSRTLLSLFEAISGGIDWDTLVTPLIQEIHPIMGLIFSFYIAFAVLAMLNVVTGVFVEAALAHA